MTTQPVPQKRCTMCGKDVAGQKRTKDAAGNYYCAACSAAKAPPLKKPAKPPVPAASHEDSEIPFADDPASGIPVASIPVAKSGAMPRATGVQALGKNLVVDEGAILPKRCVLCNKEASRKSVALTFEHNYKNVRAAPGGGLVGALVSLLATATFYAILNLGVPRGGPVKAHFYFCQGHKRKRFLIIGIPLVLLLTCLILVIHGFYVMTGGDRVGGWYAAPVVGVPFFGLISVGAWLWTARWWLRPKGFTPTSVLLAGASPKFLEELPQA